MKIMNVNKKKITTALLLAAGTGSRLKPLTDNAPKCLTEVNEITILERLVRNLELHGFDRLIVVTGYLSKHIQEFLRKLSIDMEVDYICNDKYLSTNNIYSLWKANKKITESFLLIESDLVFDVELLDQMLVPDRIAISKIEPWMKGTMVKIDESKQVTHLFMEDQTNLDSSTYKTVNIYSISLSSWQKIVPQIEQHIFSGQVNDYYETVFAKMLDEGSLVFKSVLFDVKRWYEILKFRHKEQKR